VEGGLDIHLTDRAGRWLILCYCYCCRQGVCGTILWWVASWVQLPAFDSYLGRALGGRWRRLPPLYFW